MQEPSLCNHGSLLTYKSSSLEAAGGADGGSFGSQTRPCPVRVFTSLMGSDARAISSNCRMLDLQ